MPSLELIGSNSSITIKDFLESSVKTREKVITLFRGDTEAQIIFNDGDRFFYSIDVKDGLFEKSFLQAIRIEPDILIIDEADFTREEVRLGISRGIATGHNVVVFSNDKDSHKLSLDYLARN